MAADRGSARDYPDFSGTESGTGRLAVLDGWRAISILCVLAAHLLPIGPMWVSGNDTFAKFGMGIFFTLSGFLIVRILWRDQHVGRFLVRRIARIVPLAWLTLMLVFLILGASGYEWTANLLFFANLPPFALRLSGHFWSLCIEMQFYLAIALAVAIGGRRGLWLVVPAALLVTGFRIWTGTRFSIVTWLRADDIMAGGWLALIHLGAFGVRARRLLHAVPLWLLVLLALCASHAWSGPLTQVRSYLIAAMVGASLDRPDARWRRVMESAVLAYIARISFALYVFHPYAAQGWLGEGDRIVKYLKRPIVFALTFLLAHVSTFHFESRFIRWSHRRTAKSGR